MTRHDDQVAALQYAWDTDSRWAHVTRPYDATDVIRLRPPIEIEHSIARHGANRLWSGLLSEHPVMALGALTGGQAVQMAAAGMDAIYVSGWQIAADGNDAQETYPDQSLYPWTSAVRLVDRINRALLRAAQVHPQRGEALILPLIVDAEAGFGGHLHAYEVVGRLIEAGAAAVHIEDQDPIQKKCGHVDGRVLVPTNQFLQKLVAARLAADVADVPAVIIARTDALGANLVSSDADPADAQFMTGERDAAGRFKMRGGFDAAVARATAAAPFVDVLWCEVEEPDLTQASAFAEAIRREHQGVLLAYNCTLEYDWFEGRAPSEISSFLADLHALDYQYLFVTIAGFQNLSASMFEFASDFAARGMSAYVDHQRHELELQRHGYNNVAWQREVGTSWFGELDEMLTSITTQPEPAP